MSIGHEIRLAKTLDDMTGPVAVAKAQLRKLAKEKGVEIDRFVESRRGDEYIVTAYWSQG